MVVICFPGGSGGHYIGYLVKHLLTQTPCNDIAHVNFHDLFTEYESFLNFSFLDHSNHSQEEELNYIQQISADDLLVIGHFRNARAIYQQHRAKIICIQVGPNTKDLLVDRVIKEAIDNNFTQVKYNDIRGYAWPDHNPGYKNMPKWIQLEIQSMLYRMFEYWNQQIDLTDIDPDYLCTLSSDDIFKGNVIDVLCGFLKCQPVPGMQNMQQQYQLLVQQKYNYLLVK